MISATQIERIVAHAIPRVALHEATPLGERTVRLDLGGMRPRVLRLPAPPDPGAGDALAAEALALSALRAEIDLPLPELFTYEPTAVAGTPYLLMSYLEGMTLPEALPAMNEEQRYNLGSELGRLMARIHGYHAPQYGQLSPTHPPSLSQHGAPGDEPEVPASDEDRRYIQARLDAAMSMAEQLGELDQADARQLASWAPDHVVGTGQPACLLHGDLRPERILVRRRERGWILGGVTGWGCALTWRPAWDHVALLEQFPSSDYFSLRVGYGNAYDATTERRYDQLREFALLPFRTIFFLEAGRPDLAMALLQRASSHHDH